MTSNRKTVVADDLVCSQHQDADQYRRWPQPRCGWYRLGARDPG